MLLRVHVLVAALLTLALAGAAGAADQNYGLKKGTPDLKSAGALAFGPDGILFVGDSRSAAVFAFDTGDRKAAGTGELKIEKIDEKLAGMLGTTTKDVLVNDLAVNPATGNAFLSVSRGAGANALPALIKIDRTGKIEDVLFKDLPFARTELPKANERRRQDAITQIGYVPGRILVAGLSNEEFSSKLRSIPFPFQGTPSDTGTGIGIYHGSHGKFETASPIRTFVSYDVKGESYLLAAYTCTPLVKLPLDQLKAGENVKGTTIAELGMGNAPLDMIVYQKDGKDYILMTNSRRGVMKIPTEGMDKAEGITQKVAGTAGTKYETIAALKGVEQMAKLDKEHALVLVRTEAKGLNLETVPLP